MFQNKHIRILLYLLLVSLPVVVNAQSANFLDESVQYVWPTDASTYLSSTFGETRSAHFHAGLDIKTWGQEGFKVFATRDGIVHRIGISPNGYGKVIYLKHDDGSYSVYAHLNRFESKLQAVADSIRLEDDVKELDHIIEYKNISYSAGDVIAYTGSTGIGPPHLHFELRTPDFQPFNPLLTNLKVSDSVPPIFSALGIESYSLEDGTPSGITTHRPSRKNGTYDFGRIQSDSPFGLAVDVYDRKNKTTNAYAVYELLLIVNTDTVYSSKVDQFSYSDASQMFIDRSYPLLFERRKGFQRLYRVNGNTLPFSRHHENRGILYLDSGIHHVKVVAKDFYGNESIATLQIESSFKKKNGVLPSVRAYPKPLVTNDFSAFQIPDKNVLPEFLVSESAGIIPANRYTDPEITYLNADYTQTLHPGKRYILHLPDQTAWIDFPKDALFDTLELSMHYKLVDGYPDISFSPSGIPLQNEIRLNIIKPDRDENEISRMGIFWYNSRRSRYEFAGSKNGGNMINAEISRLDRYVVKSDTTAPAVKNIGIRKNLAGREILLIHVRDKETGIDYLNSTVVVDGKKGITEYDPDKSRLVFYHPDFKFTTGMQVVATVADRVGNKTRASFLIDK
ncbi:MAG TPA: M23 family metallopeptidase [Balneolaceae bacterium]|nr:M23 family metallopeptidase [Balneolaceae bacterium]